MPWGVHLDNPGVLGSFAPASKVWAKEKVLTFLLACGIM